MRRLSSVIQPRYDRAITLAFVAMAVLAVVAAWRGVHHGGSTPWAVTAGCMASVIAALSARSRRMLASDMVDEAWIDGGDLLLKRGGQSIRVPLTSVVSVEAERVGSLVTLELGPPCALGSRVRFLAAPRNGRDIRAELRRRMAETGRHA